jgi:competence protein ComEA
MWRSYFRSVALFAAGVLACSGAATTANKKNPPAHPVDLNTATLAELETLPGIGAVRAQAILDFRAKNKRFRSVNDLLAIRGFSKNRVAKLRPYIALGPPPAPASATPKHSAAKSKPKPAP